MYFCKGCGNKKKFYCIRHFSHIAPKTEKVYTACVEVVKNGKTVSQCLTNMVKNRHSAERKITLFDLFYQSQITGMVSNTVFLKVCHSALALPKHTVCIKVQKYNTADLVVLKFYSVETVTVFFLFLNKAYKKCSVQTVPLKHK